MQIIIHRGTNQIGGCITEIKSNKGTKIAIDIGANLPTMDGEKKPEIELEGLTKGKPNFDAVFITHYHGDHIGLYNKVLPEIPIYIGEVSKKIYKIVQMRLEKANLIDKENLELIEKFKTYKIPEKVRIKDILITPIEVDHSAFDSHMFLIECDGKKVLHTGDFRTHGQRGKAVVKALEKYVSKVDCLICEGTTFSREKQKLMTEMELQDKAEEIFKENKYTFVMCSSTNIDRIAAIHKATLKANKLFICDDYQKEILTYINSISRSSLYKFEGKMLSYGNNIVELMRENGFVMLIRYNYISKLAMKKFPDAKFIYSQWEGYLDERFKEYEYLQKFVPKDYIYLHTSGHADYLALENVLEVTNPNMVIPIHTENKEKIKEYTDKAVILEDGEIFEVR